METTDTFMPYEAIDAGALLASLHAGVVVHGPGTEILYANPRALELLRLTATQALGKAALDPEWRFLDEHKHLLPMEQYPVNRVLAGGEAVTNQIIGVVDSRSADITWVLANAYPERDPGGAIAKVIVSFIDITSEKQDIPFEQIVAYASDPVVVTEADQVLGQGPRILYVNDAFTDLTGYTPEEVIGQSPRILQGEHTDPEARERIRQALLDRAPIREQIVNYTKGGQEYWVELKIVPLRNSRGEVTHFAAIERDITAQKAEVSVLRELATTDPLTGLLNRRGFSEHAQGRLASALRDGQELALAMIDIDFFKRINDTYGHEVGDQALIHLAGLLRASFRESDVIGRLGGEEFAVLLPSATLEQSHVLMDRFRMRLAATPLRLHDGRWLGFTASIGVAELDPEKASLTTLTKAADSALYAAKHSGRNRVYLAP